MQSSSLQKVIFLVIAVLAAWLIYYGSYLPMRKSQVFIDAMRSARAEASSFQDLAARLSVPLDAPSPVGQEELVRNTANIMLNLVSSNSDPALIAAVMAFIEERYEPIITRETGTSFGQNVYIMGAINEVAFIKTQDTKYYERSKFYFEKALELGPKRPQPLYGLFDVYRIGGDVENAKRIASQILSQWPDDAKVQAGLAEFLQKVDEFQQSKQ
ncbi:MAG: hypothetical protein AAB897_02045 [Patescibacteria group bacterium]